MKFLLALSFFLSLNVYSDTSGCNCLSLDPILGQNDKTISQLNNAVKRDFKRRPVTVPGWNLALQIETNFEAPLVGKDIYWGRIYLKDGENQKILYRDDLSAEKHYAKEKARPSLFNYSTYQVSDINSAAGLSLIKGAGAEVNVKSVGGPFSTRTGGRIAIRVKAPKEKPITLNIEVTKNGSRVSRFLLVNNRRIPFDSFKINASRNMVTGTSILNGIQNIQFTSGSKAVHVITP